MSERVKTLAELKGSAVAPEIPVKDLLFKPIVIESFTVEPAEAFGGEIARLTLTVDGKPATTTTFSKVVIKQLRQHERYLPCATRIVKKKRYYQLEGA